MSQVSGLFTRRGFNIDSIAVGTTEDVQISTLIIVLKGDDNDLRQFQGQLLKLPDVLEVRVLPYHDSIVRELLLIRVAAGDENRSQIFGIVEVFDGHIREVTPDSILIEVNGDNRRVNGIISMLSKFGIEDMARTGQIALPFRSEEH